MKRCIKKVPISGTWRSCLLVLALATIILLIRKTDSFLNPQFWAEDGVIFFLQQYETGVSAIFQPYGGYLQLVPRLIALFADAFFPYSAIPFVYNYSSLILTLFVVASIFSPRFKLDYKPLLALTIVLVPQYANEVFLNITNVQWILSVSLLILLMKEHPNHKYGNIGFQLALDFMTIILCGLTGPFILFVTPFFAWKWLHDKDSYTGSIMFAAIAISFVQLSYLSFFLYDISKQSLENNLIYNLNAYSAIVGYKVFGSLFLGKDVPYKISHYFLSVMYFGLIIGSSSLRHNVSRRNMHFIIFCLSNQLIMLLATFYIFRNNPENLIPPDHGERYFYIPRIMLTWSLIALLSKQEKWRNVLITTALILILISSLTSGFHSNEFIDYNWKLHSELIGRTDVIIPINPEGWQIHIKAQLK